MDSRDMDIGTAAVVIIIGLLVFVACVMGAGPFG